MLNFTGFDKIVAILHDRLQKYDESIEVVTTAEGTHFPLVVVTDIDTQSVNRTYGDIESYSMLSVQVDIYARQKRVGTNILSGRMITHDIASQVDHILSSLGMKRSSARTVQNEDASISRYVMVYTVIQNDKRSYFM